jgi:CBS domain-containing protein
LHHVEDPAPIGLQPGKSSDDLMSEAKWVGPDLPIKSALAEMDENGVNQLPVMANGRSWDVNLEGVISFLRIQQELGL